MFASISARTAVIVSIRARTAVARALATESNGSSTSLNAQQAQHEALQRIPFAQQAAESKILTARTKDVLDRTERAVGFPVLTYWTSPNAVMNSTTDVLVFARLVKYLKAAAGDTSRKPKGRVGLFLKSDGGHTEASLRIMSFLRGHYSHITVFAPYACASAATMLAIGANEIHMGSTSYLTAVDSSMTHPLSPLADGKRIAVNQDQIARYLRIWKENMPDSESESEEIRNGVLALSSHVHPLVVGDLDRSASLSLRICKELLSYHMKDEAKAAAIATKLNSDYPSHTFPITIKEAKRIGLPVRQIKPEVEEVLEELNKLYSEMTARLMSDYSPQAYHKNEILKIFEARSAQVFYKIDTDNAFVTAAQGGHDQWETFNDRSGWTQAVVTAGGGVEIETLHIK